MTQTVEEWREKVWRVFPRRVTLDSTVAAEEDALCYLDTLRNVQGEARSRLLLPSEDLSC